MEINTWFNQANTYPAPPWAFRGSNQIAINFDAEADAIAAVLPPGVTMDLEPDGSARCEIRICWYPWSVYGPFHECYVLVRTRHKDETVWFLPLIMTDNDIPTSCGREVWGYAKKLATMSWQWGAHTGGQVVFTMERPAGVRLLTATFAPHRRALPTERVGHHVMSHRHITGGNGNTTSELILVGGSKALHVSANGELDMWAGQGSISVPSASLDDPWHFVKPTRINNAYWMITDFALEPGRVVDDLTLVR